MGIDLSLSKNTTKVGGSFNGHEKDQTTKATVGLGNVIVGGLSIEESIDQQPEFANLNREAGNSQEITKDMERGGVDISLTVDNRMLTEKGRDQIAEDILKSDMLVDTAVLVATTDRVGLLDFNEELGKTHKVYETVKEAIANDKILAKQLQDPNLSAADKEVMLDQLTHAVMSKLGYETEGYENKIFADKTAVAKDENGNLGAVAGFYSEQTSDSYINDANINDTSGFVRVAGHESSHAMDDQDIKNTGVNYSDSDKETYADNFGNNLDKYTNLALDINGYYDGMATTNSHEGNDSSHAAGNTKEYQGLDKSKGDHCFGICTGIAITGLIFGSISRANAPSVGGEVYSDTVSILPTDVVLGGAQQKAEENGWGGLASVVGAVSILVSPTKWFKKAGTARVGDKVETPDSHYEKFINLGGGQGFRNSKTGEIWQYSKTNHSGDSIGEFKVGTSGNAPKPGKKITVKRSSCTIHKKTGC